jgi:arabinose-5-phosphate isomerase
MRMEPYLEKRKNTKAKKTPGGPGKAVLGAARAAIEALEGNLDQSVLAGWLEMLKSTKGRLVLCGVGKSGLVAQKISATFASTGCPSFFLHPTEALHGDLGMVTGDDIALVLSNSGETEEILRILPPLIRAGVPIACITSNPKSRLAQAAKWVFSYKLPDGEGCPLSLAPMASTTMQVVWGDLLAAERIVSASFTIEGFAQNHPGGSLGAKLIKTKDLMHKSYPQVSLDCSLVKILSAMTAGKLGMAAVVQTGKLKGVISDGDIRRALERAESAGQNPLELVASQVMTAGPSVIGADSFAIEAAKAMETKKITFLVIADGAKPLGILHIHDLLAAKVI